MSKAVKTTKKVLSVSFKIFYYTVFAVIIAAILYVLYCSNHGKVVKFNGYSVMHVVTGSMEPVIHTDDYIFVKETDVNQLEPGDIITFYSDDPSIQGLPNTHRILRKNSDGTFTVKGDANPEEDSAAVKPENIIGKYVRKTGFFRFLFSFTSKKKLLMLLVIIPTFLISLYEAVSITKLTREAASESKEDDAVRQAIEKEKARLYAENYKPDTERDGTIESGKYNETENGDLNNNHSA